MIEFGRSKDSLEALQSKSSVTLEDVLGVFIDLCEDVKGQGCSVDALEIEDSDRLLANLSRSGRILLKIMKKKSDQIDIMDAADRLKRQEEQISEKTEEIDEKVKTLITANEQLDAKITIYEKKKSKYDLQMDEVNKKHKYFEKLSSECERIESLINEMNTVSIEPLETQIEDLKKYYEVRKEHLEHLQGLLKSEQKKYAEQSSLFEQNKAARDQMVQKINILEETIRSQNQEILKLTESKQIKAETVQELLDRQNQLDKDVVILQNEIDRLREHLANSNYDDLCEEKDRLYKEKMALDQDVASKMSECEEILASIQECKDDCVTKKERYEKEKSRLIDENSELNQQIKDLEEVISNKQNQKEELEKTLSDAEDRYKQLRKWFESLEVSNFDERLKIALKKTTIFEEAQKELFYEVENIGLAQTISMQEANEKKDELRRQLKEIEDLLNEYQRKYKKICELLSD